MFSQKTFDFLFENRLQNCRTWFHEHKEDYKQYVFNPTAQLVTALEPVMTSIDDMIICDPRVDKSISRVYRDTRFSKDKSLYRDVVWCVFMREKKLYNGLPGFFIEYSPRGFCYGCGYHMADTQSMNSMRSLIIKNDPLFQKAYSAFEKQDLFEIEGDFYKRSKFPDQPDKLKAWLDRKSIAFIHRSTDMAQFFSDGLAEHLAENYKLLAPVYNFLMKAELCKGQA